MTLAGVSCIMPVSRCRDILFSLIILGSAGSRGQTWAGDTDSCSWVEQSRSQDRDQE